MKQLRLLVLILLVFLFAWSGVTSVQAHAMLIRSIPAANASLASAPAQVELFFSEAVASHLSKIVVKDASGKQVDGGDSHVDAADPTHLIVTLPHLGDGIYMVVWNVISATDGHQTSGSFPFAVGKVDASAMAMAGSQIAVPKTSIPVLEIIIKGFLYVAAAMLTGGVLFTFLVWSPSCKNAKIPDEELRSYVRFSHNLNLSGLALLVVMDVLTLFLQAGQANGTLLSWPWQAGFLAFLLGTRAGMLGILRLVLAGILAGLLLPPPNRWNRWVGLAVCLPLLLTFSLQSHAAGNANPFVPVLADWIHMIAVSVWVGGLFSFLGGMWLARKLDPEPRTRLTSLLIPHFTVLAMTSVGVLVLTGTYATILRVGDIAALLSSTYGHALLIKLALAAPMLALGAINFLFTTPSMRRGAAQPGGNPGLVGVFSNLLTGEVILGVMILVWVGLLTLLPPANNAMAPMGFNQTTKADDLTVTLNIDPGQPGMNTFNVVITSGGKPVTNAQDVSLEFTSLTGSMPPSKAAMGSQGGGKYSLQGGYLAMPDNWDIKVVVTRPAKFDAYADFKYNLTQPGSKTMP